MSRRLRNPSILINKKYPNPGLTEEPLDTLILHQIPEEGWTTFFYFFGQPSDLGTELK